MGKDIQKKKKKEKENLSEKIKIKKIKLKKEINLNHACAESGKREDPPNDEAIWWTSSSM